jgi:hypothetical protein
MLARCGFARLRPLIATAGLSAGTVALLACERPEPRPPTPLPVDHWVAVPYDGGCSEVPAPCPSSGIMDANGRRCELADIPTQFIAGVDLRNAEWFGANLHGAHLLACDFRGADLRSADLRGVEIWDCDFAGADLTDADLTGATYSGNNWWPAGFDPKAHGASPPALVR